MMRKRKYKHKGCFVLFYNKNKYFNILFVSPLTKLKFYVRQEQQSNWGSNILYVETRKT